MTPTNTDIRIPRVNFRQAQELMVISELSHEPLLIRGPSGGGKSALNHLHVEMQRDYYMSDKALKSEILKKVPEGSKVSKLPERNQMFGYIDCRLANYDPTDIKGFPRLDIEAGVSRWLPPSQFPLQSMVDRGEIPARGLICLEEFGNAPRAVLGAAFEFVLDRTVSGNKIADGWFITATSNSLTDMSVVNALPAPMVSRLSHAELHVNCAEWSDWAMRSLLQDKLVSYFRFKPESLFDFDPKDWMQDTPYCCPRTIEKLSNALDKWDMKFGTPWPKHLIVSFLGTSVGNEFYAYMDIFKDLPSVADVVKNPMSAILPRETSAIYAITAALARRASKENLEALYTYFDRFDKAFQIGAIKDVNRCHPNLANHKVFQDFVLVPENKEIFLALNAELN